MDLANGAKRPSDWHAVDWRQAERHVRNLRQRIFRATQERDWNTVRSLQKLMLRSRSNILVSVRRVTQVNAGKMTPGVDKVIVKTPQARGELVDQLTTHQPWLAKPVRRVYIPKSKGQTSKGQANGKKRPLGIPTVTDRCLQAMVKNALEPSWEAQFEGISYGFRPGRGCHDAIEKIFSLARPTGRKKWILDADIKGAFDNIAHDYLLETLGDVPGRELIKQWLKAGYVENGVFYDTKAGTPQGGVISPLLANIALHGMEVALGIKRNKKGYIQEAKRAVVRYADDFVCFCESKEDAETVRNELAIWLAKRGLALSPEKTRIVHITEGFDFLGFNIRQYKTPKTNRRGYTLLIKPSNESVARLRDRLRAEWRGLRGTNAQAVVKRLNPIIRGWANYFRIGVARKTFEALDNWMFHKQVRWVRHTHPTKPWYWMKQRYWGKLHDTRNDQWVFGDKRTGQILLKFGWFPIERHILVRGTASPDDPKLSDYWQWREKAKAKDLPSSLRSLAHNQNYICPLCGISLFNDEELHVHHKERRSKGGASSYNNLVLIHLYCHQQIHGGKAPNKVVKELLLL